MTNKLEIYKCEICGNIIEVVHAGKGELVCCGKPMVLQKENSKGEYGKKHAPVITKNKENVEIKIGSVPHPMESDHYIEWIQIQTDKGESKKFLNPEKDKVAETNFPVKKPLKKSRMYCNKHGLWIKKEETS